MFQNSELIALVLSLCVLFFIWAYRSKRNQLPGFPLFLAGLASLCVSFVLTTLEELLWEAWLNAFEHLFILLSVVFLVIWLWFIPAGEK